MKRIFKFIVLLTAVLCLCFAFVGCDEEAKEDPKPPITGSQDEQGEQSGSQGNQGQQGSQGQQGQQGQQGNQGGQGSQGGGSENNPKPDEEKGEPHTHHFENYVFNNDATCLKDGTETATCSCGQTDTRTKEGSALGHSWINLKVLKEATCVETGEQEFVCKRCDDTKKESIPINPKAHKWGAEKVTIPATCIEKGEKAITCEYCKTTRKAIIPIDPKAHKFGIRTCPDCGADFDYTQGLAYELNYDGTYTVSGIGTAINEKRLYIPNSYNDKPVTMIGQGAFSGFDSLISVVIPNSVSVIGSKAFFDCYSLTSIVIPKSVSEIEEKAFSNCFKLVEVINDSDLDLSLFGVTEYALDIYNSENFISKIKQKNNYLFYENDEEIYLLGYIGSQIELELPDFDGKNYEIYQYAFCNRRNLSYALGGSVPYGQIEKIVIPESVTSIGESAFDHCGLTEITIPANVTSIGSSAFSFCWDLSRVLFEKNSKLNSISACAFRGCSGLKEITIPAGVTSIGEYAFSDCRGLKSITIPDSVTSIGEWAFLGCEGLTEIIIPESVTSIGGSVFNRIRDTAKNQKILLKQSLSRA